ncbi:MAG TPA: hypothetical protein VG455_14615 [Acidimicrobiales bacterium]|nr:hypothetical protein [Acidimicrobiales bacterium]
MSFISFLISLVITGLIVGALGRLAIPGPNPMSIGLTIAVGIGGAFVGGLVAYLIGAGIGIAFILEVLAAAGIVYLLQRRPRGVV